MPRINRVKRKKEPEPSPLQGWSDARLKAEFKRLGGFSRHPAGMSEEDGWEQFFQVHEIFCEQERRRKLNAEN